MQRTPVNKRFRVVARETRYYYLDVTAHSKAEAIGVAVYTEKDKFTLMNDPQNEFRPLSATHLDRLDPVDELKFLTR